MTMQTADCLVKLGGDAGNTVPKFALTVSEIAVLQLVHGSDAVVDVRPRGTIERSHREERQRLVQAYGREQDGVWRAPAVDQLFPGAAAHLFETFDQLELDPEFFAASGRVSSGPLFTADGPAPAPVEASEEDDGISDMPPPAAGDSERLFG
jgi:hypothetical protein